MNNLVIFVPYKMGQNSQSILQSTSHKNHNRRKMHIFAVVLLVAVSGSLAQDPEIIPVFRPESVKCSESFKEYKALMELEFDMNRKVGGLTRFGLYMKNCQEIEKENRENERSFKVGVNKFTGMFPDEKKNFLGGKRDKIDIPAPDDSESEESHDRRKRQTTTVPAAKDWTTTAGVVGVPRNQGSCGCCWAFAANAALESAMVIQQKKTLTAISEQELVDCSTQECQGGYMDQAYNYTKYHKISKMSSYSNAYASKKLTCKRPASTTTTAGACVSGWGWAMGINAARTAYVPDENALKEAVAKQPVAVGIYVSDNFYKYAGGIFEDSTCSNTEINHGVVVVGYGTENGKDFWKVKNSWGSTWGEKGYIRMIRNAPNVCGIHQAPVYPITCA